MLTYSPPQPSFAADVTCHDTRDPLIALLNILHTFSSSFHKPFSCQAMLLSFKSHQEIPHGHRTSPNHTVLYAANKDMLRVINDK
jgi:hypothetical protein